MTIKGKGTMASEAVLDRPRSGAMDQPEALMKRLLDFENAPAPVISLYLDARVDQHGQRNLMP